MTEDRFTGQPGDLVRELDPVPETPRAEIWAGIAAARRFRRPPPRRHWPWARSGGLAAAALIAGIVIGRFGFGRPEGAPAGLPVSSSPADPVSSTPPPVPPGAVDYLARTEALLASFPVDAQRGRAPVIADWARQLLLDTRLLIDSPAANNAELVRLLQDLELVLAQIASLPAHDPQQEIRLIEEAIRQNHVLARVRLAAGSAGVNGDD